MDVLSALREKFMPLVALMVCIHFKNNYYKNITYCKLSLLIGEIIHDSVEIYDPMQNQWKTGPTMNTVNQIHINH